MIGSITLAVIDPIAARGSHAVKTSEISLLGRERSVGP
jgi:hypothetical protein